MEVVCLGDSVVVGVFCADFSEVGLFSRMVFGGGRLRG